jgi:hypothetical protein
MTGRSATGPAHIDRRSSVKFFCSKKIGAGQFGLTLIGGRVKGTIHAHRVKLIGSAVVEGDILHRSLSVDENARFEESSRREETAMEEVGGKTSLLEDFSVSAVAARSG